LTDNSPSHQTANEKASNDAFNSQQHQIIMGKIACNYSIDSISLFYFIMQQKEVG
jgi:hypothetical protein